MDKIRWTSELLQPTELESDSTAELVFQYNNQNTYSHHIRSFFVVPMWDISDKYSTPVDIEIPSGEVKCLPPIKLRTPPSIGGKQGFQLGVEVRKNTEAKSYKEFRGESLHRVKVGDYNEYRPLFFNSGDNRADSIIRRLLYNWGFDIREIYEQQDVIESFKEGEDLPIAVIGVVFPSDRDSSTHALLNSAVSTALSNNVISIIFKYPDVELVDISHECIVINFDPNNELYLEREAGPQLLRVRSLKEIGLLENIVQWIKRETKELPGDLVENWVEKTLLSLVAADKYSEDAVEYLRNKITVDRTPTPSGLGVSKVRDNKITFVADKNVNLSGWTIETRPIGVNTYYFSDISLYTGQIYEITSNDWEYLKHTENEFFDFRVYNSKGQIAINIGM